MKKNNLIVLALVCGTFLVAQKANAQAASYSDPAAAYARLLIEKNGESGYQQINNYKVTGTQYLFGGNNTADVYTPKEKANSTEVSYDTYKQRLEVYQDGSTKPLLKNVSEIDSFVLRSTFNTSFAQDLFFVNSAILDSTAKSKPMFLQVVSLGKRFELYKAYHTEMNVVSTNYIQSDLRQFDLAYDYYYIDNTKPGIKKLKTTSKGLANEFKNIKDVSDIAAKYQVNSNQEQVLKEIFLQLNN